MKKLVVIGLMVVGVGCTERRISPVLREDAKVVIMAFSPAQHGRTGGGMTVGFNGKMGISFPQSVDIPEVWATVFECKHGRFVVNGKGVQAGLHEGQQVTVFYQEVLECKKGTDECTFEKYDFLRAEGK